MLQPRLRIGGMTKRFGAVTVLGGVDLDIHGVESTALMGASGAGKSTLSAASPVCTRRPPAG